ncbi:hypothetical protein A9267_18645 [Shewanella sp. UCD-FRSSP16_17]|uniref:chalcone isomerase family protein n=1 Tax=Shewanella sp. UCD-FRSSP16_17 TaxID=1853256 RepID=UPI0007EEA1DC|nr:chalcone isomerase family protein [Shewanella sp. UCD-FRSSP16_17]OBT03954.1 hypothetical protein A9267_18645 [Shewanella sp. UCD-FRSSP16_17]
MNLSVILLGVALAVSGSTHASQPYVETVEKQIELLTYEEYQFVKTNTRRLWFVDYYDITHLQNPQGDSTLILKFIPDKLTQNKVRRATIEALEGSNPSVDLSTSKIQALINSLSIEITQHDVITIVYKEQAMQIQHNNRVVYAAEASSIESTALKNIWLGEEPVDDLL